MVIVGLVADVEERKFLNGSRSLMSWWLRGEYLFVGARSCGGFLPAVRQQFFDAVVGVAGKPLEHVA